MGMQIDLIFQLRFSEGTWKPAEVVLTDVATLGVDGHTSGDHCNQGGSNVEPLRRHIDAHRGDSNHRRLDAQSLGLDVDSLRRKPRSELQVKIYWLRPHTLR